MLNKIIKRITRKKAFKYAHVTGIPRRGKVISVVYFDIEREAVRVQEFKGVCVKKSLNGINTQVTLRTAIRSYPFRVTKSFFLHSPAIIDLRF